VSNIGLSKAQNQSFFHKKYFEAIQIIRDTFWGGGSDSNNNINNNNQLVALFDHKLSHSICNDIEELKNENCGQFH
jgi:hypothetical protein